MPQAPQRVRLLPAVPSPAACPAGDTVTQVARWQGGKETQETQETQVTRFRSAIERVERELET